MVNITDDLPYFSGKTSTDKINSKEISKEDIDSRIKNNINSEHNKNYVHDFRKDIPPFEHVLNTMVEKIQHMKFSMC